VAQPRSRFQPAPLPFLEAPRSNIQSALVLKPTHHEAATNNNCAAYLCVSCSPNLHNRTLKPGVCPRRPDSPTAAITNVHDHAHKIRIVIYWRRARRAGAGDFELGRRIPRHTVPEHAAEVEPVTRPAGLLDRQPVVSAVAADVVDRVAHLFSSLFSLLLPYFLIYVFLFLPVLRRLWLVSFRTKYLVVGSTRVRFDRDESSIIGGLVRRISNKQA